ACIHLGLQHVDVVVDGGAFRVLFRIGADRDLEPADAVEGGGQFGGVGVAVGAGRIGAADASRAGRVAAQGDDVIDADSLVALDDLIDLGAAGLDAGEVGGRTQGRFTDDALDGAVGPLARGAARPIGDGDEGRVQRLQPPDGRPQIGL